MSIKRLTNEEYSFLNLLENLKSKDIKSMCLVNRDFKAVCDQYLNQIYKKLLKRDFNVKVENNKVFQVLYDLADGIYRNDYSNVYVLSFLYKSLNTEMLINSSNIDKLVGVVKFTKNPDIQDVNGVSPLMLSVMLNNTSVFKKIMEYKPNVNLRDINDYGIYMHMLEWRTKNLSSVNTVMFDMLMSLDLEMKEIDVYSSLANLSLSEIKKFTKKYINEMNKYSVLNTALMTCENPDVIMYIIREFYKQFDEKADFLSIISESNLDIEESQNYLIQLLRLNKIDKSIYIKNQISNYLQTGQDNFLNGFLLLMEDEIDINDVIFELLKKSSDETIALVFRTFGEINLNLKDETEKSAFKYFLDRNLPLSLIKENDKIDYNELIKDLIF